MRPIGITRKHETVNPFTGRNEGELMIVHHCLGCNRVTTNRIAGDDDGERIIELLTEHYTRDSQLLARLHALGIRLLTGKHLTEIRTALYGEQW